MKRRKMTNMYSRFHAMANIATDVGPETGTATYFPPNMHSASFGFSLTLSGASNGSFRGISVRKA